jgi:hypothetical protein
MTEPETSHPIELTETPNLHPKRIDPETAPRPRIKELEVVGTVPDRCRAAKVDATVGHAV